MLFNYVTCSIKGVGEAQSVYCLTRDWTSGIRSAAETNYSSLNLCAQTSHEAHPASYQLSTGGPFTEGQARPKRDADHSSPSGAEIRALFLSAPAWRVAGQILFSFYNQQMFNSDNWEV
jgi:hypothetical protein